MPSLRSHLKSSSQPSRHHASLPREMLPNIPEQFLDSSYSPVPEPCCFQASMKTAISSSVDLVIRFHKDFWSVGNIKNSSQVLISVLLGKENRCQAVFSTNEHRTAPFWALENGPEHPACGPLSLHIYQLQKPAAWGRDGITNPSLSWIWWSFEPKFDSADVWTLSLCIDIVFESRSFQLQMLEIQLNLRQQREGSNLWLLIMVF